MAYDEWLEEEAQRADGAVSEVQAVASGTPTRTAISR
jgi:hypothetical protein